MRHAPEAAIVQCIIEGFTWLGYTVLRVGQWRADKAGSDPGVPDLLVSQKGWGFLVGLEVKCQNGHISKAQKDLADDGKTFIVKSWEEALEIVTELETTYGLPHNERLYRQAPIRDTTRSA